MRADSERVRSENSVSSPEDRRRAHEASVDASARGAHTFQSSALELVSIDLEPQSSATTLRSADREGGFRASALGELGLVARISSTCSRGISRCARARSAHIPKLSS